MRAARPRRPWWRRLLFGPWMAVELLLLVVVLAPLPFRAPLWVETWRQPVGVILFVIILGIAIFDTFYFDQ